MIDYIKRKDVVDWISKVETLMPKCVLEEIINKIPSVDIVEVVRCKDCKFTRYGGDERNGILYFCSQDCKAKKSSDFCSYGEREEK